MTHYQFREGSRITAVSAQTIGDELSRIHQEDHAVTPTAVVNAARPDDAPLHPAFEWDDAIAAEAHREHQARYLIRSVTVIRDSEPEPVYTHVQSIGYLPTPAVASNDDLFQIALRDARNRVRSAKESLAYLRKYSKGENLKTVQKAQDLIEQASVSLDG
ncbi:MAG: hypothetical protein EBR82_51210 [Caulobacteraceae bacterium]|nr:hypothetical protein [Caulobacteraceae bacterium]